MRLLLIAPQYPPALGGAELQAQRLAKAFSAAGIRVTVLTQPRQGARGAEQEGDVRILRVLRAVALGPVWGLTYMHNTSRWMRRLVREWDIVHNQQVGLHSWVSARVAAEFGKPCVLRFACYGPSGDLGVLSRRRLGSKLVAGLRPADRFIALTDSGAAEIAQYGFSADRIRLIPNGIDVSEFQFQQWRRVTHGPLRLLFVGRLSRQKGVDVLLDALALLREPQSFCLRVIGEGSELEALRAQAIRNRVSEIVEFCGARPATAAEYGWSDLVVVPSRFEGMPNVVLEALACGRPVLGTEIAGVMNLVLHGSTGWLVPSDDPRALAGILETIAMQREAMSWLGIAGRQFVEARYSVHQAASTYVAEYQALLAGK